MLVKICGIQTLEAARTAVQGGADFIGFVFADSRRKITPETALEIANALPKQVKKVGVFVNETVEKMTEIANMVGLDFLQLHGNEPASVAEKLSLPVIKAYSADLINHSEIRSYPCDYYLIDSPKGKYHGGTGKTFDWKIAKDFELDRRKLILAGGLTPDNVREAITVVGPVGVDVSSGVETDGKKDTEKIREFIKQAKSTGKDESIDNLYNAR
ncbi:Phosphoribosylanthranilate isomerase [Caldibacillus thermoamylovorans]|uniref:phosphoribosylanthranilate isomerase n=1 Tax=Caldibacillus thermoamylovorans TaxID=35841 RepID=UPI0005A45C65|nr:phosphoribosylanthranilate isomerase [Caldibacillus thermoamylovorans]KIO66852.1 Phosphoribosylanthranilate isomerase [Caldibacillus thermoamylovorans]